MARLKSHAGGHVEHPSNLADCVDKASLCMYIERRGGHGIVVIVVDWACRYVHFLDRVLFS